MDASDPEAEVEEELVEEELWPRTERMRMRDGPQQVFKGKMNKVFCLLEKPHNEIFLYNFRRIIYSNSLKFL